MGADESKLPAAMLLVSGCEFQKVRWLFGHIIFTESILPLVVSFDSEMTEPHFEQNVRSTLRHDSKTRNFRSLCSSDSNSTSELSGDEPALSLISYLYSSSLSSSIAKGDDGGSLGQSSSDG